MEKKKNKIKSAPVGAGKSETTKSKLPEGVTAAPRNAEEMHLDLIREWPDAVKVYLKVSDDTGKVLGDKRLEKKVKAFCDEYGDPKVKIENPEKVLESAR